MKIMIYNMKLTEELVEKLVKGQKDLNNLTGIEFSISTSEGKGSEVRRCEFRYTLIIKWMHYLY